MSWCWWCCHTFETTPVSLPYEYDDRRDHFKTVGRFCSWGCVKAYNVEKYGSGGKGGIISNNITLFRKRKNKGKLVLTKIAPHRLSLIEFGGTLTIEEFRGYEDRKDEIVVKMPNEIYAHQKIHKLERLEYKEPTATDLKSKLDNINDSEHAGQQTLKLKRPQPLKRNVNNITTSLGITFKPK